MNSYTKKILEHNIKRYVLDIVPFVQRGGLDNDIVKTGVTIYFSGTESLSIHIDYNILINKYELEFPVNFDAQSLTFKSFAYEIISVIIEILQRTKDAYSGCGEKRDMYYIYSLLKNNGEQK